MSGVLGSSPSGLLHLPAHPLHQGTVVVGDGPRWPSLFTTACLGGRGSSDLTFGLLSQAWPQVPRDFVPSFLETAS